MVVYGVNKSIDVDTDDLLNKMSDTEKFDLMVELMNEYDVTDYDVAYAIEKSLIDAYNVVQVLNDKGIIEDFISNVLEKMPPYELKKVLCDALCVDNYNNESMLREKLEKIITYK